MTGYYLDHQYQAEITRVAGCGWWENSKTYMMKWVWINMTFVDTVRCEFDEKGVTFKRSVNVNTEDKERPAVKGKRC